ncbi:zinc finger protein 470 [Papilio machaon]|uniref:zinc finger protein 470 n=1 Tax=Papilio machaon TaxID=76193 RepID=UPI001E66472C|nr:zinc finger protein 470 [Papilio machaon]
MEHIKVCRICLVMDVRMHNLQAYPLGTYFENVTGVNLIKMTDLPPFACYECTTLIKKFNNFRERCLRGQTALYGILQTSGKISTEDVKQIDRNYFHLTSNFLFSNIKTCEDFCMNYEDSKKNIKNEPFEQTDNLEYNIELDVNSIKQESNFDDYASLSMSSDDNEPLSLHKSGKGKKVKLVKKKARKKRNNGECTEMSENSLAEFLIETEEKESDIVQSLLDTKRKKRGRPKKNAKPVEKLRKYTEHEEELDVEEYVTVITLSLEEQIEEVKKRKTSSNYLNSAYKCDLCYKGFIHTEAWNHHLRKHDPSAGEMECCVCKFRFKTKRILLKHTANHEKKYACKACSYVSRTPTQARQHQRWHKGVTYKCQYCDEISTKWTSYLSHVRIKHPSQHICGACGYSFVSSLGLAMHRTMMHKDLDLSKEKSEKVSDGDEVDDKGRYCADCEVHFMSEEAWKRHLVTSVKHVPSYIFNNGCRVCGEIFNNPEELRIHHRQKHARKRPTNYGKKPSNHDNKWPTNCEHCSEEIPNAREYWVHFRRVHPDKTYPIPKNHICDVCGKGFRGNAFLAYHKRTHSEERAFKCPQCPKAFHNRINLQMHARTHSDARPHPCTLCCKAFKCKAALDRHTRCHTGVKPYECGICGKAFAQSNSCKLHVRTVHLKQPSPYLSRARLERRARLAPHQAANQTPNQPHQTTLY